VPSDHFEGQPLNIYVKCSYLSCVLNWVYVLEKNKSQIWWKQTPIYWSNQLNVLEIYNLYQLHLEYCIGITYHVSFHFNILFVKQLHVKVSVWGEVSNEVRSDVSLIFWTILNYALRFAVSSTILYHTLDATLNITAQWMNTMHNMCLWKFKEFWNLSYKGIRS
jgi:hypothetical protein